MRTRIYPMRCSRSTQLVFYMNCKNLTSKSLCFQMPWQGRVQALKKASNMSNQYPSIQIDILHTNTGKIKAWRKIGDKYILPDFCTMTWRWCGWIYFGAATGSLNWTRINLFLFKAPSVRTTGFLLNVPGSRSFLLYESASKST